MNKFNEFDNNTEFYLQVYKFRSMYKKISKRQLWYLQRKIKNCPKKVNLTQKEIWFYIKFSKKCIDIIIDFNNQEDYSTKIIKLSDKIYAKFTFTKQGWDYRQIKINDVKEILK